MPTWNISRRTLLAAAASASLSAAEPVKLPTKVRVALWGLDGHPTEISKPLDRFPDVEIVGIQDPDAEAIERFKRGKRWASARSYSDPRRMLDVEKPDLVAVCNSNGDRAAGILECAARKLPLIAEKPLATRREDLERVKQAIARSGVKVGMLLPMRLEAHFLALRQIVASGAIGEVIQISAQKSYKLGARPAWMLNPRTYGSTIIWIGVHMIDLMRWTSGRELTSACSFMGVAGGAPGTMENSTATSFRLDNHGTATLHMDYCRPQTAPTHGDDRLRLAGTRGVAEYMLATGVTVVTEKEKPTRLEKLPEEGSIFAEFLEHVYLGKPTGLPLSDIYKVSEATLSAHEAAVSGKLVSI